LKIYVCNQPVFVAAGMTVRHALLAAGCREKPEDLLVRDEWGNEVGLDGALHDGQQLFVTKKSQTDFRPRSL
jgi:hypothetical protein